MMKLINFRFILILIIASLIIIKFFNTPYNLYSVLLHDHEKRMTQAYGYCNNESWGFYNYIQKKFNIKDQEVAIINDEGFITLEHLFNLKRANNLNSKYLIILNYISENNQNIYESDIKFISNYKVLYRYNNCYLMELHE